jgi:hypothetical protein
MIEPFRIPNTQPDPFSLEDVRRVTSGGLVVVERFSEIATSAAETSGGWSGAGSGALMEIQEPRC